MKLPDTYRKVVATRFSTNFREAVEITEEPLPAPGPEEILIKVGFAGVNASDVMKTAGFSGDKTLPVATGLEGVGEVAAVGDKVTDLKPGDIVAASDVRGGFFAEYKRIKAAHAVVVPELHPRYAAFIISAVTPAMARVWTIFLALRRLDRWLVRARGGTYPFILPGKIRR